MNEERSEPPEGTKEKEPEEGLKIKNRNGFKEECIKHDVLSSSFFMSTVWKRGVF